MRRCALALFAALALPAFGAVPTVQITGNVLAPDLTVPTSGKVTCRLSEPGTAMDGVVAQRVAAEATFTLGSGGALPATAKLVSNAIISPSGTVYSCLYSIIGANGRAKNWTETWQVPSQATINIGDIPLVRTGATSTVTQVVGAVPTLTASASSGSVGVKLNSGAGICLNADANPPCTVRLYYDPVTGNVVTGGAPTYTPESSCTYLYSAWGTCQSAGTQTRTVVSATPNGCTGTPILSQGCTYNAPACTSWTYSEWTTCAPSGTQTRTVLTSSPSGCEGGSPVLSQSCTYNPIDPPGGDAIAHCAQDALRATGTTYYVCNCDAGAEAGCTAGNDGNAGTSASAPLKTFSAAQTKFRAMAAGDTVALCKGGSWVGVTAGTWRNANCTNASSTCDLRAYTASWGGTARPYVSVTGTAIDFSAAAAGTSGYRFQGISWKGTAGTWGFYTGKRNLSDVLVCDNKFDGFGVAIGPMIDRLYVVSNQVVNSGTQGFIGGTNNGRIENNTFSDSGTANGHHAIYLGAGITDGGTNVTVRGNHSTRSSMSGGRCIGSHVVAHGQFDGLVIEGNTIEESVGVADQGCFGIDVRRDAEVPSGTVVPEYFHNVTIRGNTLKNLGNTAVAFANCQNCAIENNLILMEPTIGGTGVKVQADYGPQTGTNGTDDDILNVRVRNNTVYGTTAAPAGVRFERAGGGGHEIYNNAFYLIGGTCVGETSGVAYNAYNGCTTSANSSWFVNAGSDFTPGASSPLVDAGTTRSGQAPSVDILGNSRDASPDLGAYERSTSGSVGTGAITAWVVDGMTRVGQWSAAGSTSSASVSAAKGEYEPFQVIVKAPSGGLSNVVVTASDLTGPSTIPATNLKMYRERYVTITTGSKDPGSGNRPMGPGVYPDALIPLSGAFAVAGGENQPIWVDLFVPRGTPAGTYTGWVTVNSTQGGATVPVSVTVWNFELPVKPSLKSSFGILSPNLTDSAWQQMAVDHKVMPTWLSASEVTALKPRGLNEASLWHWPDQSGCNFNEALPSAASFTTEVGSYASDVEVNVFIDEPEYKCVSGGGSFADIATDIVAWSANLHQTRGKLMVTVEPRTELMNDGSGRSAVDIWVPLASKYDAASPYVATARSRGDQIWSYTAEVQDNYSPKWLLDFAPVNFRIMPGFISASQNLQGILYWAVNYQAADPYNAPYFVDGSSTYVGEGILMYPGSPVGVTGPVASMRLKWIRKGIEDYEIYQMLKAKGGADASYALSVAQSVGADFHYWSSDPAAVANARLLLGQRLHSLSP